MKTPQLSRRMMKLLSWPVLFAFGFLLVYARLTSRSAQHAQRAPGSLGLFESQSDVGSILHPGLVEYDPATKAYTVIGSGENMWLKRDDFQFVWKKVSRDVTLTADVAILGTGGEHHRKAVLMIRQSLDADSAYADAALHGDGLTSLQFRDEKGGITHEVQANVSGPTRLRLMKRGERFYMWTGAQSEAIEFAGGSARVPLKDPFYVGLGVCAHDKDAVERALFTNVELAAAESATASTTLYSTLETVAIASTDARVSYVSRAHMEAPNWTRDGSSLLVSSGGEIERVAVSGGKPGLIDTGFANHCNRYHGVSPDGTLLAISDETRGQEGSLIYTIPIGGGMPKRITQEAPSYWHSWSHDAKTIAFTGKRNGKLDVYNIPSAGGQETRLTTAGGINDGPDFSPDDRYIYFNSDRTGSMQIWRMAPDGSHQEQVTTDDANNAFPHVSPDGRQVVFLTYAKSIQGYPENADVTLRMLSTADKSIKVLAKVVGGRGTLDVPSWSPDSSRLAFVSYQSVP